MYILLKQYLLFVQIEYKYASVQNSKNYDTFTRRNATLIWKYPYFLLIYNKTVHFVKNYSTRIFRCHPKCES